VADEGLTKRLNHEVEAAREKVQAAGSLCVTSGRLEKSRRRLWVHSEFGPAIQEKDTNQDYVIAWQDDSNSKERTGAWAIVMADGVTSSYWAERAAELACWVSLAGLVDLRGSQSKMQLALSSIHAAGNVIGELADVITKEPGKCCPEGEFEATWEYTLAEGLLLQTTLTLVWWDGRLHIAMVGDGAVAIREPGDTGGRMVAGSDFETHRVHALGPNNRQVAELDGWDSLELKVPCSLAVFTDGVARGVGGDVSEIFERADAAIKVGETNPAQRTIDLFQQNRPTEFEDNLTLGLVYFDD
jgi:hypothetical protein